MLTPPRGRSYVLTIHPVRCPATPHLDSLDEARLSQERVCHFTKGDRNSEARFPIGDVLWHLVEEELQHRGELNALSWQLDIDPPIATVEDWNASKAVGNQG